MLLATSPPSGSGVTESLALAQAPLTRMAPAGTFCFSVGWVLVEKSPPFCEVLCDPALWPQAGNDTQKARTNKKRKNPEYIFLLRIQAISGRLARWKNWRDTLLSRH